ncbi:hypothetical protein Pse7367_2049 [Thalassoporum mexicanum PCC 7367]|uniref:hypothetical protein n=1 Tax=Thalassoporum mexicanum TaxID=3457544 RepID=UPI00029F8627|nr:hypothetical protein [Pseudanabaena sp. PCC 7367]AFY70318.1 hypothetical protein Pse7367_2049 [Pseudanabaena sp. PCC 7367]
MTVTHKLESYKTLTWQQQLGNLASTLKTIASKTTNQQYDQLTIQLLREGAVMIEHCISNVPTEFHLELAAMQRELLTWRSTFPIEQARHILALHTCNQSDRLLQMAGYLIIENSYA